jgi:hypothetical protein
MAKAFWAMNTEEQVQFFEALAKETKASGSHAYGYGEMQWCMLRDELRKNPEANAQHIALSLWAFDFMPAECYP